MARWISSILPYGSGAWNRYAEASEPMLFIAGDILIRFVDDSTRATLEVLADLSLRTQVIFSSHHARLVELARDAAGDDRLTVHHLGSAQLA